MAMMRNGLAGFAVVLAPLTLAAPGKAQVLDDELEFDEWDAQVCHTAYARAELALFPAETRKYRDV